MSLKVMENREEGTGVGENWKIIEDDLNQNQ